MKSIPLEDVISRLKHSFPGFSPQYQAGAKYLIDFPEEVAVNSMRSIAASAGVHPSTLVRLAQDLGYEGWPDLKQVFVDDVREKRGGYAKHAARVSEKERLDGNNPISELFGAQRQNLQTTELKAEVPLIRAAEIIESTRQVHIAGFLGSFPIAYTFYYLFGLFRPAIQLLNGSAGPLEIGLRAIEEGDCLFIVSFAPYGAEQIRVVQAAKQKKAKIVVLTDSKASPIALGADVAIVADFTSPSFFPSIVAGTAAAESLAELLFLRQGSTAVKRIEAAEREMFDKGVYIR